MAASCGVVVRWSTGRGLVTAGGECVVTDLADGLVEVPDRRRDTLPGRVRGQVHGHVQAEPDVEEAGDDGVEQFQVPVRLLSRGDGSPVPVRRPGGHGRFQGRVDVLKHGSAVGARRG